MKLRDWLTQVIVRVQAEDGQTMAEYGLLLAVIAIIALAGAQLVGTNVLGVFNSIAAKL